MQEDFESGAFAPDWKLQGTGATASNWNITSTTGGFGASTHSMLNDNYDYDAQGAHDAVWTAKYDFANVQNAKLFFDVAYAPYGGQYMDSLEVLASTDCGATFTSYYLKGGVSLSTAPQFQASIFIPTATQWRTDTVDVTSLAGNSEVLFSFTNIGRFGQALYVDNINLGATFTSVNEIKNDFTFSFYPNPVKNNLNIFISTYREIGGEEVEVKIIDIIGKEVLGKKYVSTKGGIKISTLKLKPGAYFLKIKSGNNEATERFIKVR